MIPRSEKELQRIVEENLGKSDLEKTEDIDPPTQFEYVFYTLACILVVPIATTLMALLDVIVIQLGSTLDAGNYWIACVALTIYFLLLAILPALIHEVGHMLYGNIFHGTRGREGSRATTNLNHIWSWPTPRRRIVSVAVGPLIDAYFFVGAIIWFVISHSPAAIAFLCVSFARLLWQFNLLQIRDGRLLLNLFTDRPDGFFDMHEVSNLYSRSLDLLTMVIGVAGFIVLLAEGYR